MKPVLWSDWFLELTLPFLGALAKKAPKNASKLGLLDLLFLKTGLKDCHGSFCHTFCVTDGLTVLDFEALLTYETSFMVRLVSWNSPPFLGALAIEAPKMAIEIRVAGSGFSQNWLERLSWFLLPHFCVTDGLTVLDFEALLTYETSFMVGLVSWNPPFSKGVTQRSTQNCITIRLARSAFSQNWLERLSWYLLPCF